MTYSSSPLAGAPSLAMPVGAFAYRPPIRVAPTDGLRDVERLLTAHRVHAVLVEDGDGARGWVTVRGLLQNAARNWATASAGDAVTEKVVRLEPTASALDALEQMLEHGVDHVLVGPHRDRGVSVVAASDMVAHVAATSDTPS